MRIIGNLMILFALYFFLYFSSGCGTEMQPSPTPIPTFTDLEITLNGESVSNSSRPANGQTVNLNLLLVPDIFLNHVDAVISVEPSVPRYRCDGGSPGRDQNYPFGFSACFFDEFSLIPGRTTRISGFYNQYSARVDVVAPNLATHYRNFYPPNKRVYLTIDPNDKTEHTTAHLQNVEDIGTSSAKLMFKDENAGKIYTVIVDLNRTQFPRDNVSRYQNLGLLQATGIFVLFR